MVYTKNGLVRLWLDDDVMTALERIKNIEGRDHYALMDFTVADLAFLLKSFRVMESIASDFWNIKDTAEEFEKRMADHV